MNQPSRSRHMWAWGGLAGTVIVASVGCAPNAIMARQDASLQSPIVRAQTPDPYAQNPDLAGHLGGAPQYVSHEGAPIDGQYCPPQEGAYCPPGYMGGPCGLVGQSYSYDDPGTPVYPPGTGPAMTGPGSPGAVIQYPYYTTKGPDDFLLDQDGRY